MRKLRALKLRTLRPSDGHPQQDPSRLIASCSFLLSRLRRIFEHFGLVERRGTCSFVDCNWLQAPECHTAAGIAGAEVSPCLRNLRCSYHGIRLHPLRSSFWQSLHWKADLSDPCAV